MTYEYFMRLCAEEGLCPNCGHKLGCFACCKTPDDYDDMTHNCEVKEMSNEMSDAGPTIEPTEQLASSDVKLTREQEGVVEVHFRVGASANYGYFTSKEQVEQFERDLNEMMQAKGYIYNGPLSISVEERR